MTTNDQLLADIDERDAEISSLRFDLDLQTKAAWDNHSKVAQLTAELEKVRDQLTAANHRADGLAADVRTLTAAQTAYANENAWLRSKLADLGKPADAHHWVSLDGKCEADCPECAAINGAEVAR